MSSEDPRYWREKAAHLRRLKRVVSEKVFIDLESVAEEYEQRAEKAETENHESRPER